MSPNQTPPPSPTSQESDSGPPHRYTAHLAGAIEARWQGYWEQAGTFRAANPGEPGFDSARPKYYCLDMFPYPSGAGLHVGHPEGYTATDIICRYMRMRGYNVLHPMGWDAFGLPAEQYAVQTGVHPAITTRKAIETFRRQLKRFGFSYDWSREIATIDPDYYRWTQWIFLQIYNSWYDREAGKARPISELIAAMESGAAGVGFDGEIVWMEGRPGANIPGITGQPVGMRRWHQLSQEARVGFIDGHRLAYVSEQTVNWCPRLGTVLANEEVIDGRSERGGFPVYRKSLKQWMLRITAYAERLLKDLEGLDWPESTRTMQSEWIGRSEGAEIDFELVDAPIGEFTSLRIYTTRPDTIFGATYMVVAPEHPLVQAVLDAPPPAADAAAVRTYVESARNRGEIERQAEGKDKTGVFSGVWARNPATGAEMPVWIADYVLMGYGHGAIMAVPAHDQRDFDFARRFALPIRDVVYPRTVAAMQFFAVQAAPEVATSPNWAAILAEFLREVTTNSLPPRAFWDSLRRSMAASGGESAAQHEVDAAVREHELPAEIRQRQVSRLTWSEAIESLGFTTFLEMRRRFEDGGFQSQSGQAYEGTGFGVHSEAEGVSLDGLPTAEAREAIVAWLEREGIGRRKINYKLRDWLFSRQRYWGEPFPIVWDAQGNHYPVGERVLPLRLPEMEQYRPPESDDPLPMLASAPREWQHITAGEAGVYPSLLPPETPVHRETNTMPNWAGSCWYYLRYCDPRNASRLVGQEAERYWMDGSGVDLYIGGAEHAVLHLLYARFWHKVLYDLGHVSTSEPMRRLYHQGMITSFAYQRKDKSLVPIDEVWEIRLEEDGGGYASVRAATGGEVVKRIDSPDLPTEINERLKKDRSIYVVFGSGADVNDIGSRISDVELVTQTVAKMSKALKNVINPDDVIASFGADTFRMYEMYMGPLDASKPWNPRDITGLFRFLQRAWRLVVSEETGELRIAAAADAEIERELHRMISRVGPGIEKLALNTAIAAMIEFVNAATSAASAASGSAVLAQDQIERFALVLAPFAPHIAEEIWSRCGRAGSLSHEPWPGFDESLLRQAGVELPVQINGKVRARITVPTDAPASQVEAAALKDERIREFIEGKAIAKIIVIPGKMVNIVVK
jgi:leucyl-tRNA synthetase